MEISTTVANVAFSDFKRSNFQNKIKHFINILPELDLIA